MRYVHITAHDLLAKSTYYTSTHFTAHRGLSRRARAAARPLPGRSVGRTDSVRYHPEARTTSPPHCEKTLDQPFSPQMRDGMAPQRPAATPGRGFAVGVLQVKAARHARREIAGARARQVEQSGRSCRAA